ncbi:hypothetical protein A2U01_0081898, partial [Trifolium medium]|nr:hypothetical protein [Trifolium medium]
ARFTTAPSRAQVKKASRIVRTYDPVREPDYRQVKKKTSMDSKLIWPSQARRILRTQDPVREPDYIVHRFKCITI